MTSLIDDIMDSALSSEGGNGVVDHRWSDDGSSLHEAALGFELESSGLRVRRMQPGDLTVAADICFTAFNSFNASVGLDPEFPVVNVPHTIYAPGADGGENGIAGFVCVDGSDSIVGVNLLDYRDGVGGIGPICSVNPGAGKLLMKAVMKEAAERGVHSVRLLQVAHNARSFSLYLSLGFEPRRVNLEYQGKCTAPPPAGDAEPRHARAPLAQPCRRAAPPRRAALALPRRALPPRSPAATRHALRHPGHATLRRRRHGLLRPPPPYLRHRAREGDRRRRRRADADCRGALSGRCDLPHRMRHQGWPCKLGPLKLALFPP